MDHSEALKAMLQDIINDRHESASVTMHDYFVSKTREVAGLSQPTQHVVPDVDDNQFDDVDDE